MHYFSYGSNMSIRRLLDRVPSANRVGTGILEMHILKFHKVSTKDGSAKCDASETGVPGHLVYGVVFHISAREKANLDIEEGLGYGYEEKEVLIKLENGTSLMAFTYYATSIDPALRPLDWYREHVVRGARENALPEEYIRMIEAVEYDEDPDHGRRERELFIYG